MNIYILCNKVLWLLFGILNSNHQENEKYHTLNHIGSFKVS